MKGFAKDFTHNLPPSNVLNAILNGADTFLYVSDLQTDEILFINDNMKAHFNLGDNAVGSTCWKVLQSGLDKRCDFCPIHRLLENGGEPIVWEEHNTVTSHHYRNLDRLIEWHDGRMAHLQHSTDLTDIKRAEMALNQRLKQQELMSTISQSFTSAQDTTPLIQEALKMAGEFMGVNQAFLSKYQKDEACLDCLYEWYDDAGQSYIENARKWPLSPEMDFYKDLLKNGYAAISDYAQLTHPNFQKVKEYNLRAFLNVPVEVSGEFWGVIGFIINERKYDWSESDIHLGKLLAGIFSGVVSRNIAKEELLKAKQLAELASQAKGKFLSHMSHEMRTPMNAIIGMTTIARKSGDPQKMEYCLDRIDNASKQLLGLINDILDMSKIEASKLELSPAEFEFEKMLANVTGVVNFRVEEKRQSLVINIDPDVPTTMIGDEMRLSQVIVNLLTNAAKFTPQGGTILLNVHVAEASEASLTLLFEVIDNGIGISKEKHAQLFDPFEQAESNIVQKYGGTGLGLAISKGIVELMEGHIALESELGQGATFRFSVRVKGGENAFRSALSSSIDKASFRVLAVDGAPSMQDYFMRTFSELGILCDTASSADTALELMEKHSYHIFILDWLLPGRDSLNLAKRIKDTGQGSMVVMVIPQNDWSNIEREAESVGIDRFVFKPFFPSMLIDLINEFAGAIQTVEKSQQTAPLYNFQGHTLLVAEDIEINREILFAILEDTKLSIDFAVDGIQVIHMFKSNPTKYSLILMDVQMPGLDGYQAAQQIRACQAATASSIPIIAMTAHVYREDVERCLHAGMNDHIGKPIDAESLHQKLDFYLNPTKKEGRDAAQ